MAKESSHIASRIAHKPLLALDSRFIAKLKLLFDSMPEDYTGYIDVWESVPWQEVTFDDGIKCNFNYATQTRYFTAFNNDKIISSKKLTKLYKIVEFTNIINHKKGGMS